MAKTIANFLVGVGLDTKDFDKGSRSVDTALSGFRSKAGVAGGAIAAAFGAVGAAAIAAGDKADKFALATNKFDTSRRFIYNLGNAFKLMGGDANEAIDAIAKAESILGQLNKGDASALESAALARVNVESLQNAKNGEDLLKRLSDIMPDLQKWQQRSLQETFGLSNAALATLTGGRQKFEELIQEVDKHADNLDAAAEAGRAFNSEMAKLGIIMGDVGNILAKYVLPSFTDMLKSANEFIEKNKPKFEAAAKYAGEHSGSLTAATAGFTSSAVLGAMSTVASKVGMKMVSNGLSAGSRAGFWAGIGASAYTLADVKASDIKEMTGYDVSQYYRSPTETIAAFVNKDAGKNKETAKTPSQSLSEMARGPNSVPSPHVNPHSAMARSDDSIPQPVRRWMNDGVVSGADAASSSPSVEAAKRTSQTGALKPQMASEKQPIVIENNLTLDGRELTKFVQKVTAEDRANAQEGIQSAVSY